MPKDPKKGADALAAFAKAIKKPNTRQQLAAGDVTIDAAIQQEGGDPNDLDDSVKGFLNRHKTASELKLLSDLSDTMINAELSEQTTGRRTLAKF